MSRSPCLLCGSRFHSPHSSIFILRLSDRCQTPVFFFQFLTEVNKFSSLLLDLINSRIVVYIEVGANPQFANGFFRHVLFDFRTLFDGIRQYQKDNERCDELMKDWHSEEFKNRPCPFYPGPVCMSLTRYYLLSCSIGFRRSCQGCGFFSSCLLCNCCSFG